MSIRWLAPRYNVEMSCTLYVRWLVAAPEASIPELREVS